MSYKIIGKYIKDLIFNIPNPKTFLLSKEISNYKINIDIKNDQINKNIEVLTSLSLVSKKVNTKKLTLKLYMQPLLN